MAQKNVVALYSNELSLIQAGDTITPGVGGTGVTTGAKGNLLVWTGANATAFQTVGSNGQVLTANSSQTNGLQWATPGTSSVEVVVLTNLQGATANIGAPMYASGNDAVKFGQANAIGTSRVIGLVSDTTIANNAAGNIAINGVMSATTGQWDAAFGTSGGLVFNTVYYLSEATAGTGNATAPSTAANYVRPLGIAISTTELNLLLQERLVGL